MDEMKIKLSTKFMRGIVGGIIRKIIVKQFGIKPDIQLDEISVSHNGGKVRVHISLDGEMTSDELSKLLKDMDLL